METEDVWTLAAGKGRLETLAIVTVALLDVVEGEVGVLTLEVGDKRSDNGFRLPETPVNKGDGFGLGRGFFEETGKEFFAEKEEGSQKKDGQKKGN